MAPFISLFVFNCEGSDNDTISHCSEAQQQDEKLIFSWPYCDKELARNRMGIIEALLSISLQFLHPGAKEDYGQVNEPLIIHTRQRVIVADILVSPGVIICLVCESTELYAEKNDSLVDSHLETPQQSPVVGSRWKYRFGPFASAPPRHCKTEKHLLCVDASSRYTPNLNEEVPTLDASDARTTLEILKRFIRHLKLFHGPLERIPLTAMAIDTTQIKDSTMSTNPATCLSTILDEFVPRFIYAEALDFWNMHGRTLAGSLGIQHGTIDPVGFLEAKRYLFELESSDIVRSHGASLYASALFFQGYYIGGTIDTDDLSVLYDYLISSPSGCVNQWKLNKPPWMAYGIRAAEHPASFYGLTNFLNTSESSRSYTTNDEQSISQNDIIGYLLGPHNLTQKTNEETILETLLNDSMTLQTLLLPRIYLPSGKIVLLLLMLFNTLGQQIIHDTEPASQPVILDDNNLQGIKISSLSPVASWFRDLTITIISIQPSLQGLDALSLFSHTTERKIGMKDKYRFIFYDQLHQALRRSHDLSNNTLLKKTQLIKWPSYLYRPKTFLTKKQSFHSQRQLKKLSPPVTMLEASCITHLRTILDKSISFNPSTNSFMTEPILLNQDNFKKEILKQHTLDLQRENIDHIAIKTLQSGWIIGGKSFSREYTLIQDPTVEMTLTESLEQEQLFLDEYFITHFI